jgi:DNA-directed RNA polymerase specialized sigma24 family protein
MQTSQIATLLKKQHVLGMELLYEYSGTAVHGILARITSDNKLTEKLMVQTFINAWRSAPYTLTPDHQNLLSWIMDIAVETVKEQLNNGQLKPAQLNCLPELGEEMKKNGIQHALWNRLEQNAKDVSFEKVSNSSLQEGKLQYAVLAIRTRLKINEVISQIR